MKEIKQNKNSSVIRFLAFVIAVVVLVFSISVPSFAISLNGEDFTDQPINSTTTSSVTAALVREEGTMVLDSHGHATYNIFALAKNGAEVYVFGYTHLGNQYYCFVSPTVNAVVILNQSANATATSNAVCSSAETYGLYYSSGRSVNSYDTMLFPTYSTLDDGLQALSSYINTPPAPEAHSFSGSLPAGNAIILDVSGNNAEPLSLSTSSALRHKDNWSDGNQMMGYFASAPTSLNSPFEGTHSITWRGTGSPNLFGGYNTWNTTAPLLPTGNYLVIVNPAYPNDNPDSITSNQASNGSISITCGFVRSATVVPLSSAWDNGSIVSSSGNIRLDGEYDSETDSWSFVNSSTGVPQNPVSGGLTDVDAEHITINDWLQNISHQIGSFFSGAIGAVSTLVSAGSDFIHSLSGLYAWLPAPVYSVLVSALILVITIGVIKVFI